MASSLLCHAADLRPEIPDIIVNFHHDYHFEVTLLHISELSPEMHAAAVSTPEILQAQLSSMAYIQCQLMHTQHHECGHVGLVCLVCLSFARQMMLLLGCLG